MIIPVPNLIAEPDISSPVPLHTRERFCVFGIDTTTCSLEKDASLRDYWF